MSCEVEDGDGGLVTGRLLEKLKWLDVKFKVCDEDVAVHVDLVEITLDVPYVDVVDDDFKQMAGYCGKSKPCDVVAG